MKRWAGMIVMLTLLAGCASPWGLEVAPAPSQAVPSSEAPPTEGPVAGETDAPAHVTQSLQVSLYEPDKLLGGQLSPSGEWQVQAETGAAVTVAPALTAALVFPGDPWAPGFPPYLVNLDTGEEGPLPLPEDEWYSFGDWLGDGRLALVGRKLYLAGPLGEDLQALTDETFAWGVWPSPDGRNLALWAPSKSGEVQIVDLETGVLQTVAGPFRRGCQDCGLTLAWSPDSTQLAGTDHDHDAGPAPPRIRIVDPFRNEQVKTVEGLSLAGWLPEGDLLAHERSSSAILVVDQSGQEKARYVGFEYPSPDGRFLLKVDGVGAERTGTLLELATGVEVSVEFPGFPRWTRRGELIVITPLDQ